MALPDHNQSDGPKRSRSPEREVLSAARNEAQTLATQSVVRTAVAAIAPVASLPAAQSGSAAQNSLQTHHLEHIYVTKVHASQITSIFEDGIVGGVPFHRRVAANDTLTCHLVPDPPHSDHRIALVCNTGPKGSGKTVLMLQNLVEARNKGCVSFGVEFNGQQPLRHGERAAIHGQESGLARAIGVRILANACRIEWPSVREHADAYRQIVQYAAEHGNVAVTSAQLIAMKTLTEHVNLAKALTETQNKPAFLAIDEFSQLRAPEGGVSIQELLSRVCVEMDVSMQETETLLDPKRIYMAVSVYDGVDLAKLTTGSSRPLRLQSLPPILPVLLTTANVVGFPQLLRVLCVEEERKSLPIQRRESWQPGLVDMALLLRSSWGHPRRLQRLVREVLSHELKRPGIPVAALLQDSDGIAQLKEDATAQMDDALDAEEVCPPEDLAPSTIQYLLEGLFRIDVAYKGRAKMNEVMRTATLSHYQIVPATASRDIGYLPMVSVKNLAQELADDRATWLASVTSIYQIHDSMVNQQCAGEPGKDFEKLMHHVLSLCFKFNADKATDLFDALGDRARAALGNLTRVTEVVFATCDQFPFNAYANTTAQEEAETVMKRIMQIGSSGALRTALAFMPMDAQSIGYDHYLVLPKDGGGRAVLAFQEMEWFHDWISNNRHVVCEARWGRQYFQKDTVCTKRALGEGVCLHNPFLKLLEKYIVDGNTDIVFVLVTPNKVQSLSAVQTCHAPNSTVALGEMKATTVLADEGMMSLEGMRRWCPTVAHAALGSLKLRSAISFPSAR